MIPNKKISKIFREGDDVFDLRFGKGKVITIETSRSQPVHVDFGSNGDFWYCESGRFSACDTWRSLFFQQIEIPVSALSRPRFRAKINQTYFHINSIGLISRDVDNGYIIDNKLYEIGNYFESEQEAKESDIYKGFVKTRELK